MICLYVAWLEQMLYAHGPAKGQSSPTSHDQTTPGQNHIRHPGPRPPPDIHIDQFGPQRARLLLN